jgi:hypothetical protein
MSEVAHKASQDGAGPLWGTRSEGKQRHVAAPLPFRHTPASLARTIPIYDNIWLPRANQNRRASARARSSSSAPKSPSMRRSSLGIRPRARNPLADRASRRKRCLSLPSVFFATHPHIHGNTDSTSRSTRRNQSGRDITRASALVRLVISSSKRSADRRLSQQGRCWKERRRSMRS